MSPITTPADAERAIDDMTTLIAKLSIILEQEADLIRAGRVKRATELSPAKSQLANALFTSGEKLKANAKFLLKSVPTHCATLRQAQEAFRAILQKNMVLLATTHAISESIVRRLSGDLARKASPQVYGASGRTTAPNLKYSRPLAVSRTL